MDKKAHWENVYQTKPSDRVSWFQAHLAVSLELIEDAGLAEDAKIIDVGGGASTLADDLLAKGYGDVTVLDISSQALDQSRKRLGEKSKKITWLEADILKAGLPRNAFDLWHDRAVFHFLTSLEDRKAYLEVLRQSVKPGGTVIMASFSLEGPEKCSGLNVMRYNPETMSRELGGGFTLIKSRNESHRTPFDTLQDFVYCLFRKGD